MMYKTLMAPNPGKGRALTRVFVLSSSDPTDPMVVDVSAIYKRPDVLHRFNKSYTSSLKFYATVGGLAILAGLVASFTWHWWAFALGFLANYAITKANYQSAAQFTVDSLEKHPDAYAHFSTLGLIWYAQDGLDKQTPETARRLLGRAMDVAGKYLALPMAAIVDQVSTGFPEHLRTVSLRKASFGYADLAEFSFEIMDGPAGPILTVFGSGPFSGFLLQRSVSGEGWHTGVEKPAAFRIGPKAERIADCFGRDHGISNISELVRRVGI